VAVACQRFKGQHTRAETRELLYSAVNVEPSSENAPIMQVLTMTLVGNQFIMPPCDLQGMH